MQAVRSLVRDRRYKPAVSLAQQIAKEEAELAKLMTAIGLKK